MEEVAEVEVEFGGALATWAGCEDVFPTGWWREILAGLPVRAEGVVFLALFWVAEDFVSFGDVFEFCFGVGAFIDIGVVLACKATISLADFISARVAWYAEDLVVVLVLHSVLDGIGYGGVDASG